MLEKKKMNQATTGMNLDSSSSPSATGGTTQADTAHRRDLTDQQKQKMPP
jgi:hypothetical protein